MTVEPFAVCSLEQLSFPTFSYLSHGYYRSKLLVIPCKTNPLLAAGGPLFSLLDRLCIANTLPPLQQMRENIEHELKAFISHIPFGEQVEVWRKFAYYLL